MTFRTTTLIPAAVLALALPAFAQDTSGSDTETMAPETGETELQASPEPGAEYSEEKIEAFVAAVIDVSELRADYDQRLLDAGDDAERQELLSAANDEMRSVVEDANGITVDEYIGIAEASRTDEALNARVTEMLRARLPGQDESGEMTDDG